MVEDGTRVTQTVNITATFSGSFMACDGVYSVKKNNGYTFRVLTNTGVEIYRGKAAASEATQPLKNSIYE
jgi:hypothetical protein